MKNAVIVLMFAIAFIGTLNVAVAKTNLTDIRKYDTYTSIELRKSLFDVQKVMQDFELSKGSELERENEALAYLELSYKLLKEDSSHPPVDDTGDTDTFLLQAFNADKKAFGKALVRMTPTKIKFLRQTLSDVADALKNGQDSRAK